MFPSIPTLAASISHREETNRLHPRNLSIFVELNTKTNRTVILVIAIIINNKEFLPIS